MRTVLDQMLHLIAATAIVSLTLQGSLWTSVLAGFLIGLVREITEEGSPITTRAVLKALHSFPDLLFWALGGAVAFNLEGVI